eukprot:TRINITY_DN2038_c0_g1_i3.p1 TRINITY_DN2038_c0_g1~~TRINITY_DN2038_c0_g1_i3.p1  ORF type:complete len:258 (-),score=28.78 TRINITY_DN2038_c0_g1_i3:691-1428(-)
MLQRRRLLSFVCGWHARAGMFSGLQALPFPVASHICSLLCSGAGSLWMFGWNNVGQCGTGAVEATQRPVSLSSFHGVTGRVLAVACGGDHTVAIVEDNSVWTWGKVQSLVFNKQILAEPQQVPGLPTGKTFSKVACGELHTFLQCSSGEVFAWGDNKSGQLGLGDTTERRDPTHVTYFSCNDPPTSIVCGVAHNAAILASGKLLTWGNNFYGQVATCCENTPTVTAPLVITGCFPAGTTATAVGT